MSNRKKKTEEERMIEAEGAKIFGKHVSKEKGRGLLVASLLAHGTGCPDVGPNP